MDAGQWSLQRDSSRPLSPSFSHEKKMSCGGKTFAIGYDRDISLLTYKHFLPVFLHIPDNVYLILAFLW